MLWKKSENKGKARREKVGVLIEKEDGKKSVKIDLVPVGNWVVLTKMKRLNYFANH